MASHRCMRFNRRKERQLFLMFVAIVMIANCFLFFVPHFFFQHTQPHHLQPHGIPIVAAQGSDDGGVDERLTHPLPQSDVVGERPQEQHRNVIQPRRNMPPNSNMTELIPRNARKPSPARGLAAEPLVHQSLSNDTVKDLALSFPRLHDVKNGTVLEQAIRSLEVLSDNITVWGQTSFFKPRLSLVTSFEPKVLIDSVPCSSRGPFLLVLIPSVAADAYARQAIRSTWASPAYGAAWPGDTRNFTSLVQVVFFIGVKREKKPAALEKESRKFQDIVQIDFQESYQNLSLKTVLGVEWSAAYCPGARHMLKVDQDTFVYLPLLLDLLQYLSDRGPSSFVLGFHHHKEQPRVLRLGRWKISEDLYPFRSFPRYVYGASYVLSARAVKQISAVWRYMPVIPNEDAYTTGILARTAGVIRIHCDLFSNATNLRSLREMGTGRLITGTGFKPYRTLHDIWGLMNKHVN